MTGRLRGATTLVEGLVFGAIAAMVIAAAVGLLSRGGKIVELGRRTSGAETDLKILIETLSEDVAELVYLENGGKAYDSKTAGAAFSFVIRSTRAESGVGNAPSGSTGLRRIEYKLAGSEALKDCVRTVTPLGAGGAAVSPAARTLIKGGISSLAACPVAAVPGANGFYGLVMASEQAAQGSGATVACVVVEVAVGRASGDSQMEQQTLSTIVTKLWCRNRVLELNRGALR